MGSTAADQPTSAERSEGPPDRGRTRGRDPAAPRPAPAPPPEDALFDQYSRYASCAQAVRALLPRGGTVLDVGSGRYRLLSGLLPEHRVRYVDPLLAQDGAVDGEEVLAGRLDELDAAAGRFDVVVAVDTLEHVPPAERPGFVERLAELAREGVVLSGPWREDAAAARVDGTVDAVYRAKTGAPYPWLEEHQALGLPSLERERARLADLGLHATTFGNGHAPWLEELLPLFVALLDRAENKPLLVELSRRFNARLFPYDHLEPVYRRLLVARRSEEPVELERLPDDEATRRRAAEEWDALRRELVAALGRDADARVDELRDARRTAARRDAQLLSAEERERAAMERLRAVEREQAAEREGSQRREAALRARLDGIESTLSWRVTAPLRFAARAGRALRHPVPHVARVLVRVARPVYRVLPFGESARWRMKGALVRTCGWALRSTDFYHAYKTECEWRERRALGPLAALPELLARRHDRADVLVLGVIDWFFRFQRPQQLVRELARRGHRVFYVSPRIQRGPEPGFRAQRIDDEERLYAVQLVAPGGPRVYEGLPDEASDPGPTAALRRLLEWARPEPSWTIVHHPGWLHLARAVPDSVLVYDWMDNHHGFRDAGTALPALERALVESADHVFASSRWLERCAREWDAECTLLRNACEPEHFADPERRAFEDADGRPFEPRGRKVIGYVGAIAEWFDRALVRRMAEAYPDCLVLLVGADSAGVVESLRDLANVRAVGEVPYERLPGYLQAMDVCTIPFVLSELTEATNPVKAYEYLAAGKPVVATDLPELRDAGMDALLHRCADHEAFVERVGAALAERPDDPVRERRRAFAREQTWHGRADVMAETIEALPAPTVSVVVVTWNNRELTERCIESVLACDWPALEVIVVDNASEDGTPALLKALAAREPRVRVVLNEENRGFAAANNQGMELAEGSYLAILNNDTVVTKGWLRSALRHFRADRSIGLLGPITNNIGNEARVPTVYSEVADMPAEAAGLCRARGGRRMELRALGFFCVIVPREVWERVGALDENFGRGFFEDDDYCRRVEQAGLRIVCAEDVFVHHELSASFGKLDRSTRDALFEANRAYYESKWGAWSPHEYRKPGEPSPALPASPAV